MESSRASTLLADLGWLQQLARELAGDPELAADAVQDTCTAALQHRGAVAHPRAWLATVLRNCLRLRARGRRAATLREAAAARPEAGEGTADLVQRAELQQRLGAAVLALPAHYRDVVLLRFFDGLPPRVIAARLLLPVATVHSRLQRALQILRGELDRGSGGRAAWAALALPAGPGASLALPFLGVMMQTKLKVAAAVVIAAGSVTFLWPDADDSAASPPPGAADQARRRSDPQPGGGDAVPGGSGAVPGGSGARRIAVPAAAVGPDAGPDRVVVRGRVCDVTGQGFGGVPVSVQGDEGAAPAPSDAAGRFELTVEPRSISLAVADPRFVTVLGATWSPQTRFEPVLVVAAAQVLAGTVLDPAGARLPGAQVVMQLPADFDARFAMPLDRAERTRWQTVSAADGTFRLPRIPRIDGATVFAAADAYRPVTLPLPPVDDERMEIVLHPFAYEAGQLDGVVVDPQGAPVAGARVAMGVTSVVTDADGRFGLLLRRAGWPTAITAAKAGFLPARLEVPRNGGTERADWPERITLRLGGKPQSIHGRVLDQDGKAVAGALVWATDPTLLGVAGVLPLQLEYMLAGGEVPPGAARMPVRFADDPTKDELFLDNMSHMKAPTACWYFVTTDDAGSFELPGLLARDYVLRALDLTSGITADAPPTPAGGSVEIRVTRGKVWPVLRGRVVSLRGDPVPGIDVLQCVLAFRANERVPGGRFEGSAIRHGQRTKTAADGTFELRDIDSQHSFLSIYGDSILPRPLWGNSITEPTNVVIEVEARCHVEVALANPAEADQVAARDAAGEVVDVRILRSGSNQAITELDLHDGKSGVFVLSERAVKVVLLKDGVVVREVPLQLTPGRTTQVQ